MPDICHRLLYAIRPPRQIRALIGLHRDAIENAHGRVINDHIHLTIAVTEDFERYPGDVEREMLRLGDEITEAPFAMRLDRLTAGGRSVALRPSRRIGGLAELQCRIATGMSRRRLLREEWSFSPHTTLAYRNGRPFQQPVPPIEWEASDFVLIHSIVGVTRHVELARWPLAARQYSLDL